MIAFIVLALFYMGGVGGCLVYLWENYERDAFRWYERIILSFIWPYTLYAVRNGSF